MRFFNFGFRRRRNRPETYNLSEPEPIAASTPQSIIPEESPTTATIEQKQKDEVAISPVPTANIANEAGENTMMNDVIIDVSAEGEALVQGNVIADKQNNDKKNELPALADVDKEEKAAEKMCSQLEAVYQEENKNMKKSSEKETGIQPIGQNKESAHPEKTNGQNCKQKANSNHDNVDASFYIAKGNVKIAKAKEKAKMKIQQKLQKIKEEIL